MKPSAFNPTSSDLPTIDYEFPAVLEQLIIESSGSNLNGLLYVADGPGLHPTVVLLHGFPGAERNLDVAQALRRAGWNVLYFNFRGSWGSADSYSQQHTVEDTLAVLAFLRDKGTYYRVDPQRLALIGHSMGGACAFATAIQDPSIQYVASLAGVNWASWGELVQNDPVAFENLAATLDESSAPIPEFNAHNYLHEMIANHDQYDVLPNAKILADRNILLIGGLRDEIIPLDEHHFPILQALQAENATRLTHQLFDDDHVFSHHRIALTQLIVAWLAGSS